MYRAIDEAGQVVDVPLRTHRDRDSARACFVRATYRRRAVPEEVITDKHPAYVRAVRDEVPGAQHTQRGLRRANGPDTKPIARAHVPTKERLRPMRGLQSIRTGQRAIAIVSTRNPGVASPVRFAPDQHTTSSRSLRLGPTIPPPLW